MYVLLLVLNDLLHWKQSTTFADFVGNCPGKWCWFDIWWQKDHDADTNETLASPYPYAATRTCSILPWIFFVNFALNNQKESNKMTFVQPIPSRQICWYYISYCYLRGNTHLCDAVGTDNNIKSATVWINWTTIAVTYQWVIYFCSVIHLKLISSLNVIYTLFTTFDDW